MSDPACLVAGIHKRLEAWQRQNLKSYCFFVVLPLLVCGSAFTTVLYSFAVLTLPIRQQFHPDEPWTMATGTPIYVNSVMMLMNSAASAVLGGRVAGGPADTSGRWLRIACCGGAVMFCSGLVLAALAMQHRQLWLLYVGCSLMSGFGSGCMFVSNTLSVLLHFRAIGCGGLGSGLVGCILGLWPTVLASVWRSLEERVDTSGAFYVLAVGIFVLAVPPSLLMRLPPPPPEVPAKDVRDHAEGHQAQETTTASTGNCCLATLEEGRATQGGEPEDSCSVSTCTPAPSEAEHEDEAPEPRRLRRRDVVRQGSFWLTTVGVSCLLLPGFGVKLLLGPEMYAVYHSNQATQDGTSALFLLAYALTRLLTGIGADRFNLWNLYSALGALQTVGVSLLGVCVYAGWPQGVFVGLCSVLGMLLASSKVLFPLLCFKVWSPQDAGLALGLVCSGCGVAAFLGSGSAWAALCQMRMVGGEPAAGDQNELRLAVAGWFLMCSVISAAATGCIVLLRRRLARSRQDGGVESDKQTAAATEQGAH